MPRVAVIGGGLAGLTAARTLMDHGFPVSLFEKAIRPGGRASTRRCPEGAQFDHGAQYFTARSPQFVRLVDAWIHQGHVAEWTGRIVKIGSGQTTETSSQQRFVGVPGMSAIGRHLAEELPIRFDSRIVSVDRQSTGWHLQDQGGAESGPFTELIVTLPAPQAAELLAGTSLRPELAAIEMEPCWAVMVEFADKIEVPWDGAFVADSPLSWVARNSSKPGRDQSVECWVLHASPAWSNQHLESPPEIITEDLLKAFSDVIMVSLPTIHSRAAHRWRFSRGGIGHTRQCLTDHDGHLYVAGDWFAGGRVEGAFLSGAAAAGQILRRVGIPRDTPTD